MASSSGYGWEHSANCSNLRREGATVKVDVSTSGSSYYSGTLYIDGTAVGSAWASANGGSSSGSRTLSWNNPGAFSSRNITCRMVYQIAQGGGSNSDYLYPSTGSLGAATFTLTFNKNGGNTPSQASKTVTYGSTYGTLATCTRTGYTFAGWYTAASGGTKITSSTQVEITANQTLYAQWTAKTITATFNLKGGNIGGSTANVTKTETYDSLWVLPSSPARAGYTFTGWFTAATGGTQITNADTVAYSSNVTIYAQWAGNTVTCTYDAQGGTVSPASESVTVGGTYGNLPTPTRSGYTFLGWFTAINNNTQVTDTTTVTATGNHSIYAHWEVQAILHVVSGGTVTDTTAIYVVQSGSVTQITSVYSVEGGTVHQGV